MAIKISLLLLCLLYWGACIQGLDVTQLYPTSIYQCLRNYDYKYVIIRAYKSDGTIEPNITTNLNNARAALLATEIYVSPCRGKSPEAQMDQIISSIPSNLYDTLWINIEANNDPGCDWAKDYLGNCAFVRKMVDRAKFLGKNPGIFTSQSNWIKIMGGTKVCQQLATQSLWYVQHDNKASFGGFKGFGGWTDPNMKQFQTKKNICAVEVNLNFYHFY